MTKRQFSIGMPSNRKLALSEDAVISAANYCKKSACQLVVSDNSQDAAKEEKLRKPVEDAGSRYIKSPPSAMVENWYTAFNSTDADFVMMMGDDDTIFRYDEMPDFSAIPEDVVAIKPCILAYANKQGILKINNTPILAPRAVDRITQNLQAANGSNLGVFCFWRRSVLKSVMDLLFNHHPTKGTYCDWAWMNALVSSGKIVADPGTTYFYNLQNWAGTQQEIAAQVEKAYISCGLPAGSGVYEAFLIGVDSLVFVGRKDSPLPPDDRKLASLFSMQIYLNDYCKNLPRNSKHQNAAEILKLSEKLVGNTSVSDIFTVIADVLSAIKPGLGQQYRDFHEFAIGRKWGDY